MENLQEVVNKLSDTLKSTAQYRHLDKLVYVEGELANPYSEAVIAIWKHGGKTKINVGMDSGSAIIRDVMAHIDDWYEKDEK